MSAKDNARDNVSIGLSAAILAVEVEQPVVLVVSHDGTEDALPFGPFNPAQHRTLESGLRKWVGEQTRFDLGYTEQLYTFGDKGRHARSAVASPSLPMGISTEVEAIIEVE